MEFHAPSRSKSIDAGHLWGDTQTLQLPLPAPGIQELRQLINVSAPFPCTWNLVVNISHPSGAGVEPDATTTLFVFAHVGIGRVSKRVTFVFQRTIAPGPTVLFTGQIQNLCAQRLVVSGSLFSVVAGPANWDVSMWCAPVVPWRGQEVQVVR